jgi:hypothetical protein
LNSCANRKSRNNGRVRGSTYAKVKFRLTAAEVSWRQLTDLVRAAAAQPGYIGPAPASFERIADDIAALRAELHFAIVEAVRQTIGERR